MKEENSFLRKVQSGNVGEIDDRFKLDDDNKTIGFLLVSQIYSAYRLSSICLMAINQFNYIGLAIYVSFWMEPI